MFALSRRLPLDVKSFSALVRREMHSKLLPTTPHAYINGNWVRSSDGSTFDVTNPANGKVIASVANCTIEDAQMAIDSARTSFDGHWGYSSTAKERGALLQKWYRLCMENEEELARILTAEQGKPLAEARGEVAYGASFFEWFGHEARRIHGQVIPSPMNTRHHMHTREPSGVVTIITPWNFPIAMITRKVGAALAAGCTVVVKPADLTPLSALALATLSEEAGIPPGVFNVVPLCDNRVSAFSRMACESNDVDVISFTGSTRVGKILLEQSASTVKRVCLELGGNAPFIVFDSADVDLAVQGAMGSKFRGSGQTCVCANRFFVQSGVYKEFVKKFAAAIEKLKLGDGTEEGVTQGPLISKAAADHVHHLVQDAVSKGAWIQLGGMKSELGDSFYEPTLITEVDPSMEIYKTEIFGPIASIVNFEEEGEVLLMANDTDVGLAGYFYSKDISQIFRVARRMRVGMVGANEGVISCAEAAFGGVKQSGLGREGATQGIDEFTEWKYVCIGNLKQ